MRPIILFATLIPVLLATAGCSDSVDPVLGDCPDRVVVSVALEDRDAQPSFSWDACSAGSLVVSYQVSGIQGTSRRAKWSIFGLFSPPITYGVAPPDTEAFEGAEALAGSRPSNLGNVTEYLVTLKRATDDGDGLIHYEVIGELYFRLCRLYSPKPEWCP